VVTDLLAPTLDLAFTIRVEVGVPVETGMIDGRRHRCVPILGGSVDGARLRGSVLPLGADWQAIAADGLTEVDARYAIVAKDGTPIEVHNRGVRVASPEVSDRLARGEPVEPHEYYFRTHPRFTVAAAPHHWLRRTIFIGAGIRRPDHVLIHIYAVA
jgi:hypothetical protein